MFSRRGEARGKCDSIFTPEPNTPDETEYRSEARNGGVSGGVPPKELVTINK
jgi:hypothetical protein